MWGGFEDQGGLFSYISPEARIPARHPLKKIRELVREVLGELNRSLGKLYASEGRPSIPPEQLLSALLLQVFYGIRSERQLMEQLAFRPNAVEHLQQQGAQQLLRRDRETSFAGVKSPKAAVQLAQDVPDQRPDLPQRMVRRHPGLRRDVRKQPALIRKCASHARLQRFEMIK